MPVDIFETSLTEKTKYPTKNENDNRYLNLTGDEMVGYLNMSGNKIYFDESKKNELSYREIGLLKFLQFKTVDGLAVTDLNDIVMCQFLRDGVQFNNKRSKNVGDPVDENDVVNKKYVNNRNEDLNINGRRLNLDRNKQSRCCFYNIFEKNIY